MAKERWTKVFVPKKNGYGYTFNWHSPISWIITVAVVALFIWRVVLSGW